MLPSPSSSPPRPVLINCTNDAAADERNASQHPLLTPPPDRKRPPAPELWASGSRKRVKLGQKESAERSSGESDDEDVFVPVRRGCRASTVFGMRSAMMAGPSTLGRICPPTRSILQSFVSSNKSDVFKCHSVRDGAYMSPPYACAYSHSAKEGKAALLAVSTEQGAVHVFDTYKRQDWDPEPQRCTIQPHNNGIFDVQWSRSDDLIATAAADQTVGITRLTSHGTAAQVHTLVHHQSTVKCVAWDPTRDGDILCSGSRDGTICVWDLRQSESMARPVIVVSKAHDTGKPSGRKGKLSGPPARGVTSLLFSDVDQYGLISGGSYDGILRQWDLRYIDTKRKSKRLDIASIHALTRPAHTSSDDPTTYAGTRRARGITSLTAGTGPSRGLLFALANDSRVHTYDLASLAPLSGRAPDADADVWACAHPAMRTNSFYVRAALSPCGRWLASGGAANGSVFLFDAACSARERVRGGPEVMARMRGVELHGQRGEVGAVDWAEGMLATCADDGTVRVWRPDVEVYRRCESEPEEMRWNWSFADRQ